jgi:uroporphyrinogen-III synthase
VSDPRPLSGRRILVTRSAGQASELAERLRELGAETILIPTIEIVPPSSFAALDAALSEIAEFDLVVFTSANAVSAFAERARLLGVAPAPQRIAVVGPATARAVEGIGQRVDVMPAIYTAEGLGEALRGEAAGRRILLVLAEEAPTTLRDALQAAGAWVTVAAGYGNRTPAGSLEAVQEIFSEGRIYPDAVTFTSASTARNLVALLDEVGMKLPQGVARASIGPVTSRALVELGIAAHIEAEEPTIPTLATALARYLERAD